MTNTYFPERVVDPITNNQPSSEIEHSALIAFLHATSRIDWKIVPLRNTNLDVVCESSEELFPVGSVVVPEYPLIARGQVQIDIWNAMRADLAIISDDGSSFGFVELKLSNRFTSGGRDPDTGQLARQAEFISKSRFNTLRHVLVCPESIAARCASVMRDTISHRESRQHIESFVLFLEEIGAAIRPGPNNSLQARRP